MKVFGAIITCILLGYFWIWLIGNLFSTKQKTISLKLFGICIILVGALFAFSFLWNLIFPDINFINNGVISLSRWGYFLVYCGLIFLFLVLINRNQNHKQIRFLFSIWMILFAVVGLFGLKIGISASVLYYFILAYAEEFLKIGATENEVIKSDFYSSNVLFFSILFALGFSIIENILYIGKDIFLHNYEGILSLALGRGIFSSLLHLVTSGLIALLLYKLYQQHHLQNLNTAQKIIRIIIAILVGAIIHRGYNLAIQKFSFIVYILLFIGGYFLITYILFLCDKLYEKK